MLQLLTPAQDKASASRSSFMPLENTVLRERGGEAEARARFGLPTTSSSSSRWFLLRAQRYREVIDALARQRGARAVGPKFDWEPRYFERSSRSRNKPNVVNQHEYKHDGSSSRPRRGLLFYDRTSSKRGGHPGGVGGLPCIFSEAEGLRAVHAPGRSCAAATSSPNAMRDITEAGSSEILARVRILRRLALAETQRGRYLAGIE